MIEVSAIAAATAVLRAARDALRGLRQSNLSDAHKQVVESALDQLSDAQDRISDIQAESIASREENAKLRQQIEDIDNWQERLASYELFTTPAGGHVYRAVSDSAPEHYACPACMENQSIQVLQDDRNVAGTYSCPSCNARYPVKPRDHRPNVLVRG